MTLERGEAGAFRPARRARRPGRWEAWGLLALLAPHVGMGAWLLVVPDHVAFTASQWIVLAHVALGIVGIPVALVWAYRHIMRSRPRTRRTAPIVVGRWLLAIATAVAFASGIPAIWSSQGMTVAQGHALFGIVLAAALVLHLVLERRPVAAFTVVGAVAASVAFVLTAGARIKGDRPDPVSPEFAFQVHDSRLYDEAQWCGSCHQQNYEEWTHSTHGRSTDIPDLRKELTERPDLQVVDLEAVGVAAHAEPGSPAARQMPPVSMQCPMCHAPLTYYTDDRVPLLQAKGIVQEGITCSFCHTLRGIKPIPPGTNEAAREFILAVQRGEVSLENVDLSRQLHSTPFYVSAPETVRRYLGQGSANSVARWVGDYLIRWRPAVHSRDYHSPFIDGSQMCQGCHGAATDALETPDKTYPDWAASDYNSSDPSQRVECHDCHMVGQITGRQVKEPGRLVSWGPERPQRRSHLFLGGNAATSLRFGFPETAARQRELGRRALKLSLDEAVVEDGTLRARVTLTNDAIGHYFPAMESLFRYGFIRLVALDDAGRVIAESPRPKTVDDEAPGTPVLYRWVDQHRLRILKDTTIPPHEARTYETWVTLPPGAPAVSRVEARLGHSFDPDEFLVANEPFSAPAGQAATSADAAGGEATSQAPATRPGGNDET